MICKQISFGKIKTIDYLIIRYNINLTLKLSGRNLSLFGDKFVVELSYLNLKFKF